MEGSGRTEDEETISWTRWARRFDHDGPTVEGEGSGEQTCSPSSWIGTGLRQSEHLTVGKTWDILPCAWLDGGRREAIDDGFRTSVEMYLFVGGGEQASGGDGRRIRD